ncbi:alpha/beta hydrolase [Aerophototrophica crusticola]|uniref:Alpha/beta hydrolase n=1 Tax=Aerophototrophica crusticola TaxID=1709002 RepID=A0A858R6N2_9PROT|nr:alpha/beta hydrolase [Rhodospirillaceae bacterium B3]
MAWLVGVLLVYGAVCGLLHAYQRSLIYMPDRRVAVPEDAGLPDFRVVTVTTADGLSIDGWFVPPREEGLPTIVLFHGNGGHLGYRADKARVFQKAGYGVFLAGYRGYGGNPGSPTEQGLYADARAALDWLVGQGISGQKLVIYGESLGTGVATQMATERKAAALVLEAPFTSLSDAAASHYPIFPVRLLLKDRFDSLSRIGNVGSPLLVIQGEKDRVVPTRLGKALFARANEPKTSVWLPQAGHNDLMAHGLAEKVVGFLSGLNRPQGTAPPTLDHQGPRRGTAIIPR